MEKHECDDVLLLSGIYPEYMYKKLTDHHFNKNVQIAADVLQKHIISGLEASMSKPVKLINAPYIGVFPRSSRIVRLKQKSFSHSCGANDTDIPFWNLPLIRHFSIYNNAKSEIKRWVKDHPNGTIIAYALTLRNVWGLLYAKKLSGSIKTCMSVPDMPLYMRLSANPIYKICKRMENNAICRHMHQIDSFVLLTEHMNDIIKSRHYCVVEGIATSSESDRTEDPSFQSILYSGTLDKRYGIDNLLQAFQKIDSKNARLYICGVGDGQEIVEKTAQHDRRICYMGLVSRNEILRLQKSAAVLVNPRQNTGEYTKYSFPSKNLEYLSSGTPLVAYKLDGIPDEYDAYIHYVKDNTVESLKNAIEQVLNASPQERYAWGEAARQFVLNNKNETVQARKILDMLNRIETC